MKHEERKLQAEVVNVMRTHFAKMEEPQPLIYSIHNNADNVVSGMLARSQGRLSGVTDLEVVYEGNTLYVELKTNNGKIYESQLKIHRRLEALGHTVIICRSVEEAEAQILKFVLTKHKFKQ